MTISIVDRYRFIQQPDRYLLRIDQYDDHLTVEEKGVSICLEANFFNPDDFSLRRIADAVKKRIRSKDEVDRIDPMDLEFLDVLNYKVLTYNKNPKHLIKIPDFTAIIRSLNMEIVEKATAIHKKTYEKAKKSEESLPQEDAFLQNCVFLHLRPYLDGEITAENDDVTRAPLTQILLQKLREKFPKKRFWEQSVRERAFGHYVQIAVARYISRSMPSVPKKDELAPLIRALAAAISIDFRGTAVTHQALLWHVNAAYDQEMKNRTFSNSLLA